jgi:arylsulfatase A-like enzyme
MRSLTLFRAVVLLSCVHAALLAGSLRAADAPRPNILWLTSEDHGPHMGCYGDSYATTPHVDRLAARGMIYMHAWSCAPVCAPARTALISGLYPTSTGSEHMRSMVPFPRGKVMFPQLLREAGYYCTNHAKEDYNLATPGQLWDDSSGRAHWRKRRPGQPFFAVFNSTKSHESQIRTRPHKQVHDPAGVRVPAYHPDTPEVRQDWAQYYDQVTKADADAGARLAELERDGLADDTIVFYFSDHGSGMPRSKRWPYDSGLHVPLVVYIPEKFRDLRSPEYKAGGRSDRLVSFVDFAPTVLSLAGVKPPDWMQGHAFLGAYQTPPRPFAYGFRGRMDERTDLVRSVTDGRFVYIRNYRPDLIYGQHIAYMFETPTTRVWKTLFDAGKLSPPQQAFWKPKPAEELYDLSTDADEVKNLAAMAEYQQVKRRLRDAQQKLAAEIRDVGFLPEGEMHRRSAGASPYDMARDGAKYPFARVFETAELASLSAGDALSALKQDLSDGDSAVRTWAALGLLMRGAGGVQSAHAELTAALADPAPEVRIAAAEALGRFGNEDDLKPALKVLILCASAAKTGRSKYDVFAQMAALSALDALGNRSASVAGEITALDGDTPVPHPRYSAYVPRLLESLRARAGRNSP